MASLDDLLTVGKNIVTAINGLSQTYLSVNGSRLTAEITTDTLVKNGAGRVAVVSVIVGGAAGAIYDTTNVASPVNQIYVTPTTVGTYYINLPVNNGIVASPGAGQTLTGSYS
jgi:hypothetical protein